MLRKIAIQQLGVGMFVAELDIPWIQSPFLRHKRLIQSEQDLRLLREAGVREVVIDTDRGRTPEAPPPSPTPATTAKTAAPTASPPAPTDRETELKAAKKLEREIYQALDRLNGQIERGEPVDTSQLSPFIERTLDSLTRNDQALITLLNRSHNDRKLQAHAFGVFTVALLLGQELELEADAQEQLGIAALIHDGGWSRLPANLFSKGKPYTPAEAQLCRRHVDFVGDVLKQSDSVPDAVKTLVAQQHELPDGRGYPAAVIAADSHPLLSLLRIADQYDELVHGLGERPGMIPSAALSWLFREARGGQFDEATVARLVSRMGVFPVGSAVKLSSGELALVLEVRRDEPLLPLVKICYSRPGAPLPQPKQFDLARQPAGQPPRQIESVINPLEPGCDPARLLQLDI